MPKASSAPRADYTLETSEKGRGKPVAVLHLSGPWVITGIAGLDDRLKNALKPFGKIEVRSEALESLDTAGAFLLRSVVNGRLEGDIFAGQDKFANLYELVGNYTPGVATATKSAEDRDRWLYPVLYMLSDMGRLTEAFIKEFVAQAIFMGHVITLMLLSVVNPRRVRWAALFSLMQRAGLDALVIVAVTNFFVGAVIAYLGVLLLQQFGASVFAVDMVSMGVLREFAPVIAAVLMAGRSASSFAAEIGAMKMNQEIDAMQVMSIDPYEALVVPRVVALVIMAPLVTFIGAIAGIAGGIAVVWLVLHNGPQFFIARMQENVPFVNFFVGMIKTPFFAASIALIGCRRGMTVKSDVISLGRQVTTAVVHAIFIIFMIDAVFAILFNGFNF